MEDARWTKTTGNKRRRCADEEKVNEQGGSQLQHTPTKRPTRPSRAELRERVAALPSSLPPRAEELSSICLIQGVNNNLLDLENLLEAAGVSVLPVSVRATRKRGGFKLSGLVTEDWPKLNTLAESLDPLNPEMVVLVRAPLSYTR